MSHLCGGSAHLFWLSSPGRQEAGGGEVMGIDRREFIRISGLAALLGLGGKGAFELLRPGQVEAALKAEPEALSGKRWAMVVNMQKLDEATAQKCISACHRVHNVPDFKNPKDPKDQLDPEIANRYEV